MFNYILNIFLKSYLVWNFILLSSQTKQEENYEQFEIGGVYFYLYRAFNDQVHTYTWESCSWLPKSRGRTWREVFRLSISFCIYYLLRYLNGSNNYCESVIFTKRKELISEIFLYICISTNYLLSFINCCQTISIRQ